MTLFPLGIDISKSKFDVALLREGGKFKHRVFPNTEAGFS
ncbi:MAG: Transposase [Acidobacteriota bacterium]|jgi:transposase|nr:Transposase [Acidobacteriota bacterium]